MALRLRFLLPSIAALVVLAELPGVGRSVRKMFSSKEVLQALAP